MKALGLTKTLSAPRRNTAPPRNTALSGSDAMGPGRGIRRRKRKCVARRKGHALSSTPTQTVLNKVDLAQSIHLHAKQVPTNLHLSDRLPARPLIFIIFLHSFAHVAVLPRSCRLAA